MTESGQFTLTRAERAVFGLRALYESRGYERFKVNKFEEYDFYAGCKSFLTSENVLTFTDSTGRLMALKPDVTLSIVKNAGRDGRDVTRVYYNESVYRDYGDGNGFREITQTGLECIGAVDAGAVGETVSLAAKSLDVIASGRKTLLAISHMGVVSGILRAAGADPALSGELFGYMEKRNSPGIRRAAADAGLSGNAVEKLISLSEVYGTPDDVRDSLNAICGDVPGCADALGQLFGITESLDAAEKEKIRIDFSVGGDMNYYTGIVFRGYLDGIPKSVLSGGAYNGLLWGMGRSQGGIGFAVTTDLLEAYPPEDGGDGCKFRLIRDR